MRWWIFTVIPGGGAGNLLATMAPWAGRFQAQRVGQAIASTLNLRIVLVHARSRRDADKALDVVPVQGRATFANPTLVHHGRATAAAFHLVTDDMGRSAVADFYGVNLAQASDMAQRIATSLGLRLRLLSNEGLPRNLEAHHVPHVTRERRRRNPAGAPRPGETWTEIRTGHKCRVRVPSRAGMVTYLDLSNGNVYDETAAEFIATHRPPVARTNPRQLSVPERHQLKVARDTLKMSEAMARVMGGPSHAEAREIIYRLTGKRPNPSRSASARRERKRERQAYGSRRKLRAAKRYSRARIAGASSREAASLAARHAYHASASSLRHRKFVLAGARRKNPKAPVALYDALGNGIAVGAVLVGTGLNNAGRSYTVVAIQGKRVRLQEHLTGRDFWTFPRHYRVDLTANPRRRNPGLPAVGSYWQRNTYPQHLARITRVERARGNAPPMVELNVVTGRGQVMGQSRIPVNELHASYSPLDPGSPYRKTLPNPAPSPAQEAALTARLLDEMGFGAMAADVRAGREGPRESLAYLVRPGNRLVPESRKVILRAALSTLQRGAGMTAAELAAVKREARAHFARGNPIPRSIARKSIRTVMRGGKRVLVGCKKKQYRPRARGRRKCAGPMRKVNPRKNPDGHELSKARDVFTMWHEFDAHKLTPFKVTSRTIPRHLVKLGEVRRIDYDSNKWEGKVVTYTHTTKRPRPILATDPDARALYLVGGKMRPTADGLVN